MANYEVMFILDPALEDDKKDATVETVKDYHRQLKVKLVM